MTRVRSKVPASLQFFKYASTAQDDYGIVWSDEKPLLWGRFELLGGLKAISSAYKTFLIENIPDGHSVHFAVFTEGEHSELKPMMIEHGEPFIEKKRPPPRMLNVNLSRKSSSPEPLNLLIGSTKRIGILEAIIHHYELEWSGSSLFPFLVAKEDTDYWWDDLEHFMEHRLVGARMIERSHCFMTTIWEHGIEILSTKLSRTSLVDIAKRVAQKQNLELAVTD